MELFYYKDQKLNFGDDLNAVLWPRILSPDIYDIDNLVVVGIGSILTEEWLGRFANTGKRIIVLGSGTSYDLPPRAINDWSVQAVRGPLTAEMIGMPDKAITDGAILLAAAPDLVSAAPTRADIVFMPHHRSIKFSNWARIAESAGMRYVTPQQPVEDVLAAFSCAKLVVTEAMHGAIVADTLRVPWIPVIISPAVDEFKWRDWSYSMEVPFDPVKIVAGHLNDRRTFARMKGVLRRAGVNGHVMLASAKRREDLEKYFRQRFDRATKQALLGTEPSKLERLAVKFSAPIGTLFEAEAAQQLRHAASGRAYLSQEVVFKRKLAQMQEAVHAAERFARSEL